MSDLACSFIVKGTFRLVPDAPAEPWADGPDPLAGDTPWPDEPALGLAYPSDFVPWKPCGEWLAVGTARPPAAYASAADASAVWKLAGDRRHFMIRMEVGSRDKSLEVVGAERAGGIIARLMPSWREDATAVPVSFALAWGGPGHPTNPLGTGADGGHPPLVRRPGEHGLLRHGDRDPAGFGPVPADWRQRATLRGTHDDVWLATRWPWLPDDIDYRHFLAAGSDQWIEGYFRGDEPLSLVHLHPTLPDFRGFLPGVRPRLAVVRRSSLSGDRAGPRGFDRDQVLPAEEVPLALDTVWIDADREKLVLVWRGLAAVATPKLPDIASVTLAAESLTEPPAAIETLLDPAPPESVPEPVQVEESEAGQTSEVPRPDAGPETRTEALTAMIDEATEQVAAVTEQLEAAGVFEGMQRSAARAPSVAELRVRLEGLAAAQGPGSAAAGQLALFDEVAAVQAAAEQVFQTLEAEQAARAQAREAAAVASILPRMPDGRVDVAEAARRGWRTLDLAGADLSGLDLAGADFAGVDLGGVNLGGATLSHANLAGARLVEASLAAANLSEASLVGADLGRADLTRADLSHADLSHADLSAARVPAVDWRGSRLTAAKLAGLDLPAADFSGCVADHADFTRANLAEAVFHDAQLAGASFAEAVLERATFTGSVLTWAAFGGANAAEASFTQCDLTKLRAGGGDFRRATFACCRGAEAVFDGTWLDGAVVTRSQLPRARFADAALAAAAFDRSDLRQSVFEDAHLAGARLTRCNLFESVFDRTDLTAASLEGSNAYGCGFWESDVDRLDIGGAIVAGTSLAEDEP